MKTIIIGDIHGCCDALNALLERVRPGAEDHLVLLGDLFDRGGQSFEVFRTVRELAETYGDRFTLLRGNHEDYLLTEKLSFSQRMVWDHVGRGATVKSFKRNGARMEDSAPWLRDKCRLFYREERFQCVHAGIRIFPLEDNDNHTLIHDHSVVMENCYAGPLTIVGHIALDVPTWFAGDEETTQMLPPAEWLPLPETGVICIDTGCGKGGRLTAMTVRGGEYRLDSVGEGGR